MDPSQPFPPPAPPGPVPAEQSYPSAPVQPLLGYIREPVSGLQQTGHLVLGPGAKREGGTPGHLPKLSHQQQLAVQKAKKYAMEQSIKIVLMKQTLAHQEQQAKNMQRQQAIVLMCRIYVGSINFDVREEHLRTAFQPFGPIKAISMSWDPLTQKHKGFAFVDFDVPEAAQIALEQMNGAFISGRNIKVGRPSNMPQAEAIIQEIQREAMEYNRVYVGGVHKDLSQDDIKSVFEAFGVIANCEMAPTVVEGRHKGYGFIEFESVQSAQDAINSMNGFDLGGQYLRVGRAITPPDTVNQGGAGLVNKTMPTASAVAAAAATAKIQALDAVAENLGVDSTDLKNKLALERNTSSSNSKPPPLTSSFVRSGSSVRESPVNGENSSGPSSRGSSQPREAPLPPPPFVPPPPCAPPPQHSPPLDNTYNTSGNTHNTVGNTTQHNTGQEDTAAKLAATAAQQLELQKKLLEGNEAVTLSQQEDMQIKGQSARHLVMQKLMGARGSLTGSRVVCLKNMVGAEEVDEQLQEEIEEECSKFGEVENVIIYQERQSEEEDAVILVKIFVEFTNINEAKVARDTLNGRFFGGRTVQAEIYDQVLYEEQDFSH